MRDVLELVDRVASSDLGVLLQGETGVGKDVIAREIHVRSARRGAPFVKVNCAAVPGALLESELFGFEPGAFTGAWRRKLGKFELASGGTIFLDEIAEVELGLQAKLLQVLQDGVFQRLGGNEDLRCDVRVLCASNRSIETMVDAGSFRQDLFFRINDVTVRIPPLRERPREIPLLFRYFLALHARALGRPEPRPSGRLLNSLVRHPFPGNVRELENLARRLTALGKEDSILLDLLRAHPGGSLGRSRHGLEDLVRDFERTAGDVPLLEVRRRTILAAERVVIERALLATHCNRRRAAEMLGVSYSTLLEKIRACGLSGLASAASGAAGPP